MKKNTAFERVFHTRPFIISIFGIAPVLNFMAQNAVDPRFLVWRSVSYAAIIAIAGIITAFILDYFFTLKHRLFFSFFVALAIFMTLNGYHLSDLVLSGALSDFYIRPKVRFVLIFYVVLLAACAGLAYVIAKRKNLISVVLAVITVMAVTDGVTFSQSMFVVLRAEKAVAAAPDKMTKAALSSPAETGPAVTAGPNVYFILPDMMVGEEIFPRFDVDTAIFAEVRAMGFDVIDRSYSNAPVTGFSLPHFFSMDYFLEDGEQVTKDKMARLRKGLRNNKVYAEFKKRGYGIVTINDGYYGHCGWGENLCIRRRVGDMHRLHDIRFLERTPFVKMIDKIDLKANIFDPPVNLWAHPNRMEIPDIISLLPTLPDGPNFVYIHHALPHYPFRFAEDCSYLRFDDVALAYGQQMKCAVKQFPKLLRAIRKHDPGAIVVIQSDHGISFFGQHLKPVSALSEDELRENLSVFSAYRLPPRCRRHLRPGLTSVNTFRLVFACLDGREPELLEDRMFAVYYRRWPSGGKVREWVPKQRSTSDDAGPGNKQ